MRTYYIFKVNKLYFYFYHRWPLKMYKIIEEMFMRERYFESGYLNGIDMFDYVALNDYVYNLNKGNYRYHRDNCIHTLINERYNRLIVKDRFLVLETDDIFSVFLNDISLYMDNLFVCDFVNRDYFWVDLVVNNRQKNFSLV